MSTITKLSNLITELENGGHPSRLHAARTAYNFKHSWLELAQALVEVKNTKEVTQWGYDSFLDYCNDELGIKRVLVDKLVTSFEMLQQYTPDRLESAEEPASIPSYQSLDYFSKAMGEPRLDGYPSDDAPEQELSPEVSGQLYAAVFEEGCTATQLKSRFDPVIRPKSTVVEQLEAAKKARATGKRYLQQLEDIEGVKLDVLRNTRDAIAELQVEMEALVEALIEISNAVE